MSPPPPNPVIVLKQQIHESKFNRVTTWNHLCYKARSSLAWIFSDKKINNEANWSGGMIMSIIVYFLSVRWFSVGTIWCELSIWISKIAHLAIFKSNKKNIINFFYCKIEIRKHYSKGIQNQKDLNILNILEVEKSIE